MKNEPTKFLTSRLLIALLSAAGTALAIAFPLQFSSLCGL